MPWPHATSAMVCVGCPRTAQPLMNASATAYASTDSSSSLTRSAVGHAVAQAASARTSSGLRGMHRRPTQAQTRSCSAGESDATSTFCCSVVARMGRSFSTSLGWTRRPASGCAGFGAPRPNFLARCAPWRCCWPSDWTAGAEAESGAGGHGSAGGGEGRAIRSTARCALVGQLTRQCSPLAPQTLQA